jgi:peptide-methionine (R)-S-oxide reductase
MQPCTREKLVRSEEEWKKELAPDQFRILRQDGTEPPFRNEYWDNHAKGTYLCAGCRSELFSSDTKFDSGTGWPSFYAPICEGAVEVVEDKSFRMSRNAVECARCGGHLGHVFEDGPKPTGLRYCMNSGAMEFVEDQ